MPYSIDRLRFGPAGVPISSPRKDIVGGVIHTANLGLDAFEMEFVYGIRLKEDAARLVKEIAKEKDIVITAHAPYYVNLNAREPEKIRRSIDMLYNSAKMCYLAGGWSVVFHPGWYMKKPKEEAYRRVKEALSEVVKRIKDEGYDVWLRPETMECPTKFGEIEEVIRLCEELENVLPCIDFAHIRYRYKNNTVEFFRKVLEEIEKRLGREALENMHIHMSGIKLDKYGTHLNLEESDIPWKEILNILKEFNVKGVVISESPNIEGDAILMKKYWESLK